MLELIDGREQMTPVHVPRPRPAPAAADPSSAVSSIIDDVRLRGDAALIELTERFDEARLDASSLRVDPEVIERSRSLVRPELIDALEVMRERLTSTCERQLPSSWTHERSDELIGEIIRPLRRVGVYAPGGHAAYPSSVLMGAVPAQVAGVEGVAVASPPTSSGEIAEPILAACAVAGVGEVYRIGGAQAIAAFAYGTETVRPVEKIVGPGNVYVTLAKRLVRGWVGIDSEAGPTEIVIVADGSADPRTVAADLVAQAEHGPNGSHVLITWDRELIDRVIRALDLELAAHPRFDDVENALIEGGRAVLVRDLEHALDTVNGFAPEHLQLLFEGARDSLDRIRNTGAVFVGPFSPVPAGDYVAGTNHVLPTGGTARYSSGLSVWDFVKRMYVCDLEEAALARLAPHIRALAEAEGLPAHSRAVDLRLGESWERGRP
ncbi:MAG: histidinol dehydrogenase [Actinomycetota bacterium]|nr:histidinol dehydrogenase [Actinomycetota bacterium]